MTQRQYKSVLFLCTGNYYRSRFAEILFNAVAEQEGLPWRAISRGLALERGIYNIGPMALSAIEALEMLGIQGGEAVMRMPAAVTTADLETADYVIALKQVEHLPLLQERFPPWADRVEFWHVEDAPGVLPEIEQKVLALVERMLGEGFVDEPEA